MCTGVWGKNSMKTGTFQFSEASRQAAEVSSFLEHFGQRFESERHVAGLRPPATTKDAQCWAGAWTFEAMYSSLDVLL